MQDSKKKEIIKKILMTLWTIYSAFTSFISPIWLTMIYLDFSGKIYQLDGMYDEGTAGIIGIMLLFGWLIFALAPNILYLLKLKSYGIKYLWIGLGLMAGTAIICCGLCGWNIVRFLTVPISELRQLTYRLYHKPVVPTISHQL